MSEVKLPEGYKQTEIGVIPQDWEVSNIKNISLSPTQNGLFYEPQRKGKGVPLINVSDMYKSAPINVSLLELFDATPNEMSIFKVNSGDLFFTRSSIVPSGIAFCNIFESKRNDVVFDSHLIRVQPNKNLIDSRYLYLNCISQHARTALISEAKTATMTTIDQAAINRCPVLIPPRKEQTAIATALSDVDNLIHSLEKLITKKEAIKTATMQQLLTGKTRLPEFATREDSSVKGFKQTELGRIPEDWAIVNLGDIGNCIIGLTYSPNDVSKFGTLVLRSSNVQNGQLAYKDNVFVDMSLPERVIVKEGDILIFVRNGSRRLIGKCALIDQNSEGHAFGAFMSVFRTKLYPFIFYQFQSNLIQNQIQENMGATINQITNKDLKSFTVMIPENIKEQSAIAAILSDMDAEIQALQQRLEKTKDIKQGMMQQLLTGKVRLAH